MLRLAFDRSASSLQYDIDGRLHVEAAVISAASVDGYLGAEIPEYRTLGLDPSRTYQLLRDPDALREAASTFDGVPILSEHMPVNAADHRADLIVGAVGTDCEFSDPYLRASLTVWAQDAIDGIENGTCRALSAAYRYKCVLEPGIWRGVRYSARMVALIANHVALCVAGRVQGAVIGDANSRLATFAERFPAAMRINVL